MLLTGETLILRARLWLSSWHRARLDSLCVHQRQLLLVGESVRQNLLPRELRRDKFHRTATLRLAGAPRSKVMQAVTWLLGQAHLVELLLCHLHELPLVLNLTLSELKRLLILQVGRTVMNRIIRVI